MLLAAAVRASLVLQPPPEHRAEKLKFGQATRLSTMGTRILISAHGYSRFRGALYVYDLAAGSGLRPEHWRRTLLVANATQQAEERRPRELRVVARGSSLGFSLSSTPEADCVVAGAPGHDLQRGAAYFFRIGDGTWKEAGALEAPQRRGGDSFGWAVAMDATGTWVAVAAKGRRANNGEVYVYRCEESCHNCELARRIEPPDHTDSVGPRGIRIRNNFGVSTDMNSAGDVLVIGCTGYKEERGAVYVFERKGEEWGLAQRLESPRKQKFGFFGFRLAIDRAGETLVVGADGEEEYRGAAYVYARTKEKDRKIQFGEVQELAAGKRGHEDNFGGSVAVSGDGRAVIVGAPGVNRGNGADHGVMYVFEGVQKRRRKKWELAETLWLPHEHSQAGNFYAWTVGVSGDGGRLVATAPDSYDGVGLATVGVFEVKGKRAMDEDNLVNDDVEDVEKEEL